MSLTTDHDLMLSVRDGNIDNLGLLFEKYHRQVFNFFLKQTGSQQASEDLVQDVFYRMLKYKHTYRAEGKFTTWMFSIAHNAKIDYYRKRKRKGDALEDTDQLIDQDPGPGDRLEKLDESELIQQALSKLSSDKREVLVLSRFKNLKYEEIGEIMGCKVGTIKARVHRALKELAEHYHELAGTTL